MIWNNGGDVFRWAHQSANQFGLVLLGNGPRFDLSGATGWLAVFDIGSVVLYLE